MVRDDRYFRVLVKWLLEGSRGGLTRAKILLLLMRREANINQISRELGLNYRTVQHHLNLLERHGIVTRLGDGYGVPYVLSDLAVKYIDILRESICRVLGDDVCSHTGTY